MLINKAQLEKLLKSKNIKRFAIIIIIENKVKVLKLYIKKLEFENIFKIIKKYLKVGLSLVYMIYLDISYN